LQVIKVYYAIDAAEPEPSLISLESGMMTAWFIELSLSQSYENIHVDG
jgi:hypothetical protein